ncbi:hypothetical protein AYL99_06460 [Fonsecaea erecta]|uniref:Transcription factor domain-containing protein n=1 Tax=Fonsecaea erecta TaxID=1367422 RepID=A0A178ZHN8_9EURO|nr:hypothetical protein AYL99_06460 [Fonsecaea erecta]OAP59162.1 hypothetical protein AYL99_06460 [Fonsecaea erecta]
MEDSPRLEWQSLLEEGILNLDKISPLDDCRLRRNANHHAQERDEDPKRELDSANHCRGFSPQGIRKQELRLLVLGSGEVHPGGPWGEVMHPSYAITPSILDTLPITLTHAEKSTLWNYFNFVPGAVYGTTGAGPFCTFRDICLPCCQRYPGALIWMLVAAERHGAVLSRLTEPPSSVRRKMEAYKAIGQLLQDEDRRYTDETLAVIMEAIVVESRFLDLKATTMHMRGLETLIKQRGGLSSLFQSPIVMSHPLFFLGFLIPAPLPQSSREEADGRQPNFHRSFSDMAKFNQNLRSFIVSTHQANGNKDLEAYLKNRRLAFNSPVTEQYILHLPSSAEETYGARTSRFAFLYLLNLILYRCSKNDFSHFLTYSYPLLPSNSNIFAHGTAFLDTVIYSLHYSGTIDPQTQASSVRLETLLWVVAKAWVDADPIRASSALGKAEELFLTETTMSAIRLWGCMRDAQRDEMMTVLRGWLVEGFD